MKKVYFFLVLIALLCNGCTASKWFLVDSYGVMTYDRITGKWELLWEFKTKNPCGKSDAVTVSDSVFVDTIR